MGCGGFASGGVQLQPGVFREKASGRGSGGEEAFEPLSLKLTRFHELCETSFALKL